MEEYMSFMEAYKLTGQAKIPGVKDFVNNLLSNNVKFLLFAHHIHNMDCYEEFLKEKGVGYIRIDGSTKHDQRYARVKKF